MILLTWLSTDEDPCLQIPDFIQCNPRRRSSRWIKQSTVVVIVNIGISSECILHGMPPDTNRKLHNKFQAVARCQVKIAKLYPSSDISHSQRFFNENTTFELTCVKPTLYTKMLLIRNYYYLMAV